MAVSGVKIRLARHRKGMTQRALAQAIGVSERNLVRWENERNSPRAETLADIAKATGQDLAFFIEDEEVSPSPGDPFRGSGGDAAGARALGSGTSDDVKEAA